MLYQTASINSKCLLGSVLVVLVALFLPFLCCLASDTFFDDNFDTYPNGALNGKGSWVSTAEFVITDTYSHTPLKSVRSIGTASAKYMRKTATPSYEGVQSIRTYLSGGVSGSSQIIYGLMTPPYDWDVAYFGYRYNSITTKWELVYQLDDVPWTILVLDEDVSITEWHELQCQYDFAEWQYRLKLDSGSWSSWLGMYSTRQALSTSIYGMQAQIQGTTAYTDTLLGSPPPVAGPVFADPPYSNISAIGAFQLIFQEYSTSTPPLVDWGYRITARNPELFYNLDIDLLNATSTIITTTTYSLLDQITEDPFPSFMASFSFTDFDLGEYSLLFQFREKEDNEFATSSIYEVGFLLSTSTAEVLYEDWADKNIGFTDPAFDDIWGLGGLLWEKIEEIQEKFPFSWFWETYDIWETALDDYSSASSIDPLSVSWTLSTSTSALQGMTISLFDLKTFNDTYPDQVVLVRNLFIVFFWLLTLFYIIKRSVSFINQLRE